MTDRAPLLRAFYGAATWLLLVVMAWLAVAVMYSLLVFVLLPVAALSLLGYVVLTHPAVRLRLASVAGVLLVIVAVAWTEWSALRTAERLATEMIAAGRGHTVVPASVLEPIASGLLGALAFLLGLWLVRGERDRAVLWDALALALVCPAVAFLMSLDLLPLTT